VAKGIKVKPTLLNGIKAEWLLPEKRDNQRVLLYMHGGGYAIGSLDTHRGIASKMAKVLEMPALIFEYRLAPENPYPAALKDSINIYKWLLENDYEANQIIFAGDSAGGGLTIAMLLWLRDNKYPLPAGAICLSPWTDLTSTGHSVIARASRDPFIRPDEIIVWGQQYANNEPLTNPYISPLFGDLEGLPPLLVQVGTEELLFDDSIRLVEKAKHQGVEVELHIGEGMVHVWQTFWQYLPEGRAAIHQIGDFYRKYLIQKNRV
jgi:acetyl esterase/lipase